MKLHFQFVPDLDAQGRQALIRDLKSRGARRVEALFPGDADAELGALHVVEPDSTATAETLLHYLARHAEVKFAEKAAGRKLS